MRESSREEGHSKSIWRGRGELEEPCLFTRIQEVVIIEVIRVGLMCCLNMNYDDI